MTTTLTDRYIDATVRTLPLDTQADVREELAAVIADDVDARLERGDTRADAEYAVLTELGDPDVLAARYADRPLRLIGPRYYLTWWRLLKLLWIIVPIAAAVGVTIAQLIASAPVSEIIGQVIVVVIGAFVHVGFWVTVVFVILERTGTDAQVSWTPDQLPEPRETGASRGDLIASLVVLGIITAALMWDHFVGLARIAPSGLGEFVSGSLSGDTVAVPVLNPGLWPLWYGALFVVIALEAALAIAVFARHGWTQAFAAVNTVLAVSAATLLLVPLMAGQLVNPALVASLTAAADGSADAMRITAVIVGAVIVGVAVWDTVDGWRKAVRATA